MSDAPEAPPPARRRGRTPPRPDRVPPLSLAASSEGLVVRVVCVPPEDVVFVKGIVEASEGVASLFAERGGELVLAAPPGRERDLDDLVLEVLSATVGVPPREGQPHGG